MAPSQKFRIVLYLAGAVYFCVVAWWNQFVLSEEVMFLATDSKEYREVALWILGKGDTVFTHTRPVLYPALISLPYTLAGLYGIWLLQVAAWILSLDLLFSACFRWTRRYSLAFLAATLFAANISVVAMTYHALTELVTILGLSCLVWLIARFKNDYANVRFGNYVLLVLAGLTLVKPVFFYPFLLAVLVCGFCYFRHYTGHFRKALLPLIALGCILLQMSIVKVRHGNFTVSTISHKTFDEYLFTQGYAAFETVAFSVAADSVHAMSGEEQKAYFRAHLGAYWKLFNQNIEENMKSDPVYLNFTSAFQRSTIDSFQFKMYGHLKRVHDWFLIIVAGLLTFSLCARRWDWFFPLLLAGGLLNYYIFATGLSFWQGDRLTLPIIALWPVLYVAVGHDLIVGILEGYKQRFRT